MIDQHVDWINNPGHAWSWAMDWVEEAKGGGHFPVRIIQGAATAVKDRFCTDGFWCAGGKLVYEMLREASDMAQDEYEKAQPGMEE